MIQRWIKAQRIGLIAYWLNTLKVLDSTQGKLARKLLKEEIASACEFDNKIIQKLPPSILNIFLNIPIIKLDLHLRALRNKYEEALNYLKDARDEKSSSIINSAQIMSHHIFHGTGNPTRIIRFANLLFKNNTILKNFEKITGYDKIIEPYITSLRSSFSKTKERLNSIEKLDLLFHKTLPWAQVVNSLYQQVLSWPLLTFNTDISSHFAEGISIPIGIDVYFDGKSETIIEGGEIIDVSQWADHLKEATNTAKLLWRSKHGNFGHKFRKEINQASVIFNFNIADDIVKGFPLRVSLKEGSANTYFSQVILSRFLAKNTSISSAVTGLIGEQCKDEAGRELLDFHFVFPKAVTNKMKYVFDSSFFERIVLPTPNYNDKRGEELDSFITQIERFQMYNKKNAMILHFKPTKIVSGWQ
ncbi:MAG: hypothetical protein SCARUB_04986 [Candidatus Scalindua rubra]|uniref:Uncharacterized protein n=1 Tax=Candidatus Scalindua rubra TaxID=1872076 RepID=A0A1E3X2Q6_9BACT|nr:MAG: hypothetical protein SCARUB_04986 [Candidatus Scalindua rubra]